MKVKRYIKGFIYLYPFILILFTALGCVLYRLNKNLIHINRETDGSNTTNYTWVGSLPEDGANPFLAGTFKFVEIVDMDIDSNLTNNVGTLIEYLGLAENVGDLFYFVRDFISYEIVAIMICAVLDVIFLIPEFYNKIEDKYIKGGKKRE